MVVELPVGWESALLGEICSKPQYGFTTKSSSQGKVKYLRTTDITSGETDWAKVPFCVTEPVDEKKYQLESGDIVISRAGSVGFHSLIRNPPDYAIFASYLIRFRSLEGISEKYLSYFFQSKSYWDQITQKSVGVAVQNVNAKKLSELNIPIAPLNEQIRIANKLDSLLAKVEVAQTRLDKIPTLLKRFRQSVLAAATSGELTVEWRERESNVWDEIKIGDIVKKIEAGKNIKCNERPPQENEFGIIKISAVTWGFYNENMSKTLFDKTKFLENRRIQVGDFLISRANTLELLGMPVIVDKVSKNLMLSDKVLRLVVDDTDKKWLNFFLRSQRGRKEIESRATGNQQSMRNIGQKALLDIDLPYPEINERKQIVHRVESLFTLADSVEKQYQQARLRTDKLTQSLLAKAFRGELVPQDPNDEPADKLLARIQAEREKTKPKKYGKTLARRD